ANSGPSSGAIERNITRAPSRSVIVRRRDGDNIACSPISVRAGQDRRAYASDDRERPDTTSEPGLLQAVSRLSYTIQPQND
ncbi:MAG: hypothetical protein M3N56_12770, partial [Actinomycetota bacterium]|nr:hypothetical protein [Actinomycetota bacterium]